MPVFAGNPYTEGPDASTGLLVAVGDSAMSVISMDSGSVLLQEVCNLPVAAQLWWCACCMIARWQLLAVTPRRSCIARHWIGLLF